MTQAERITAMEVRLESLEKKVESMDKKLDDLLALRNKGAGVFWLMTIIFGTSFAGALYYFFGFMRS